MADRTRKDSPTPVPGSPAPAQLEGPRARLRARGSAALSDAEVLGLLLRTGGRESSALDIAEKLLEEVGGLNGLIGASAERLQRKGIGEARSSVLVAALELAQRLARLKVPARKPMSRPGFVASYLAQRYFVPDQEVLGAVFLDVRHRLIADREFFRGTLHGANVEPRPVLKEGLLLSASGLILFHTHPSGDPTPSIQDHLFTRRVAIGGKAVGLTLVDHLIVTADGRWHSMVQNGGW